MIEEHTIVDAPDGYDRRKTPRTVRLRPLTVNEVKGLRYGDVVKVLDRYGKARDVRISGRPKTWKTRPDDVSVPAKYGLYEHIRFEYVNGAWGYLRPYALATDTDER